jgi:anaphase-promoting complex subunit 7
MTYMDEYAILLKSKSDYTKLNKLVHDMLQIDPARPESCVALAAMWERKDEKNALTYAEKVYTSLKNFFMEGNLDLMSLQRFPSHQSLRVDDRHITGYIMKVILEDIVPKLVLYYYVNFLLNCIFAKHH